MAEKFDPQSILDSMATSAPAWAALIDGKIDVRSVTSGRNHAALNALHIAGFAVLSGCRDPDCECFVRMLGNYRPDIKIIPVTVRADNG